LFVIVLRSLDDQRFTPTFASAGATIVSTFARRAFDVFFFVFFAVFFLTIFGSYLQTRLQKRCDVTSLFSWQKSGFPHNWIAAHSVSTPHAQLCVVSNGAICAHTVMLP